MKVARFRTEDHTITFGVLDAAENGDGIEIVELVADPMVAGYEGTGRRFRFDEVTLLAPVIPRSKVIGVASNYAAHAAELTERGIASETASEPLLFLKPNTAVIGPNDRIVRPAASEQVDFEGELAVIIGTVAKEVPVERAMQVVYGFTCANDVTARDLQAKDGQWARAKGFDTFCPIGPIIETDLDLEQANLETRVNGEVTQRAALSDMTHSVAQIVSHASHSFTLLPGDIILTGTPAGIGPVYEGDTVEVEIDGIGILRNAVIDHADTTA